MPDHMKNGIRVNYALPHTHTHRLAWYGLIVGLLATDKIMTIIVICKTVYEKSDGSVKFT